jgi:membrane-associated phospholipid phosphatase
MSRYLLHHRHTPDERGVVFASSKGHQSPLRHHATLASCRTADTRSDVATAMTPDKTAEPTLSAGTGKAGWTRKLCKWLTRWWFRAPDDRTYQRRWADLLVAAAGLAVVAVPGVLVANRLVLGADAALFRGINHWPGWLYPPMWAVQLTGVIGALPLLAAAAALFKRLRLAVALAAAALLKVWLEDVAKTFVQRGRPAEVVPDVILRGQAAAHGLSFPSGHAMVIFAIAALVAPSLEGLWRALPWALAAAVCLSRVYLGAHFPLDVLAGAGLGMFIGGVLNLVLGVPSASLSTPCADR